MIVDAVLFEYLKFLNSSWPAANDFGKRFLQHEEFIDDWLQANWELMVESVLLDGAGYLEVYGDGAEINDPSSRILRPEELPTHKIGCRRKGLTNPYNLVNNQQIDLHEMGFWGFVHWDGLVYRKEPEFNAVLFETASDIAIVKVEDLEFVVLPLNSFSR